MRSKKIVPFKDKIWLSSPTMHNGEEMKYVMEAYDTNWMSTIGENIDEVERISSMKLDCKYAVGLASGTSAIHMAIKLAGIKDREKVFVSTLTFSATVNPILYEGGVPVFIDSEYDTWNMDPVALEKAFELYPEVRVVVLVHLYGTPAKIDEIVKICKKHNAILIEDAAESLGATYKDKYTGTFGKYNCISFNGNKIITGSSGGMFLTDDEDAYLKVRKWSTQSREDAPWYQHEEIGYNYRMSNVIAGIIRGQYKYLDEHIRQKKAIYERYKKGFKDLPVKMNPIRRGSVSNYWLSCMIIDSDALARQVRSDNEALYVHETGKSSPTEILETLASYNVEGRPIWKPMHLQPIFRMNLFINRYGNGRDKNIKSKDGLPLDISSDIFKRGLCLPSDNKMTSKDQDVVIEIIKDIFYK